MYITIIWITFFRTFLTDDVKFSAIRDDITKFILTTQDSRMHPFARYVSPQASVNISTDSSHLLLSPDADINPNIRNFNLIINNITSSLTIGLSSHIAFS